MDSDTIPLDGLEVTVAETTDALTFALVPKRVGPRPPGALVVVLVAFGMPLGMVALVVYAVVITGANRPDWELALAGVVVFQLLAWLVTGGAGALRVALGLGLRHGATLSFTATHVYHAGARVCELTEVRGLRLFTYPVKIQYLSDISLPRDTPPVPNKPPIPPELAPIPSDARPPEKTEAALSLVIGEEGLTHGLLGGFDPTAVRAFADALQRRLASFRFNQGILAPLDQVGPVETTEQEVGELMNTRPHAGRVRAFTFAAFLAILNNPLLCILWCVAMLAGLYGSGRIVLAAGLPRGLLVGHGLFGLIHGLMLLALLGSFTDKATKGAPGNQ
jgi:hypothetical protein